MEQLSNEQVLDRFADLIEPVAEILGDAEIKAQSENKAAFAALAIKRHKQAVIKILAITDGVPVDEYKVNPFAIPVKVINFLNRPELQDLFTVQGQMTE